MCRGFYKKIIGGWEYQESMQKKEGKIMARKIVRAKSKKMLKNQMKEIADCKD